ncbi:MAG: glycosyltransferase family 25 protein [Erysipelotrichales bacterium]|nr:glycosyltransferase family 25 protein [Erysipelotrichales bacterium]
MEKIRCYIINLETNFLRKKHVINNLVPNLKLFNVEIVKGIDGNLLSKNEINYLFNGEKYYKNHLWNIKNQEIGCCLSHRECYKKLIETNDVYCLVLEDDIKSKINYEKIISYINSLMHSNKPRILLLSGWFWYYKTKKINANYRLCKVFDARIAHSYLINREAASIILKETPFYLADDWRRIGSLGIEIYGLTPHLIDPEPDVGRKSTIRIGLRGEYKFKLLTWLRNKSEGLIRRTLKMIGMYEDGLLHRDN